MTKSLEDRLLAHVNRPRPNISDISGIPNAEWKLNWIMSDRAQEIVAMFTTWDESTGPCPININDRPWFKKLCGLAEWIVLLEAKVDPAAYAEDEDEDEEPTEDQ